VNRVQRKAPPLLAGQGGRREVASPRTVCLARTWLRIGKGETLHDGQGGMLYIRKSHKPLSEIMRLSGCFGAGGRLATICAAPSLSPISYMIIAASVSAF
jgi:hypothetical protein